MNNPFELHKRRKLFFKSSPPNQVEEAYLLLSSMENLKVQRGSNPSSLIISYSIEHYTQEGLEHALIKEGFEFQASILRRLINLVVHYCEDVQQHNLSEPEHHTKKNEAGVFAKAYGQHPSHHHDSVTKHTGEYK